jgi:serine/threonine protein kinase
MLTERSDVYSFGVLLMEVITGRSPVDYTRAAGEVSMFCPLLAVPFHNCGGSMKLNSSMETVFFQVNLVEWLKNMVAERKAEEVVDPKMPEKPSAKALKRALLVALRCVDPDGHKRPKMGHAIHMLEMEDLNFRDVCPT